VALKGSCSSIIALGNASGFSAAERRVGGGASPLMVMLSEANWKVFDTYFQQMLARNFCIMNG